MRIQNFPVFRLIILYFHHNQNNLRFIYFPVLLERKERGDGTVARNEEKGSGKSGRMEILNLEILIKKFRG